MCGFAERRCAHCQKATMEKSYCVGGGKDRIDCVHCGSSTFEKDRIMQRAKTEILSERAEY